MNVGKAHLSNTAINNLRKLSLQMIMIENKVENEENQIDGEQYK